MNEPLFLIHIFLVTVFTLGALRIGKEALVTWICLQAILANLFVIQQIDLFGCIVTSSDVFAVGGILGLNLLQEFFGKSLARNVAWTCFYCMLFFSLMAQIHIAYTPSVEDKTQNAFQILFSSTPRLFFASLSVFFLVQQVDIRIFHILQKKMKRASFVLRNLLCLTISQLIDTSLFTWIGLYGLVSSLLDVFIISFLLKMGIILLMSPITLLAKKWIRQPLGSA